MTIEDVETIQAALNELGIMMTGVADEQVWTLHQRRLYGDATLVLNKERTRINGYRSAA